MCSSDLEGVDQLLVRHGMAGIVDFGPIDRDDHQAAVGFDLAEITHGAPSRVAVRFVAEWWFSRSPQDFKTPPQNGSIALAREVPNSRPFSMQWQ